MLKRLTFALVAISFTVPVVACLNRAGDKTASSDANMLTDAEKAACNFGFDAVTPANAEPAIAPVQDKGIGIGGRPFAFGDANGDQKADVLVVGAADKVTLYPGSGDGHFAAGIDTALAAPDGHTAEAIAVVGMGDFDGDGKKDAVIVQTIATGTKVTKKLEAHYVIGYGKADGTFDLVDQGITLADGEGPKKAQWHAIADLDGDGKDDLVYAGSKGEAVLFGGEADKKLKSVATPIAADTKDRVFTYATADGLVVNTAEGSQLVKFAKADRAATITAKAGTFADKLMAAPTDLDGDGLTELTVFATGDDKLVVYPLSIEGGASRFAGFKGSKIDYADYTVDLVGDPAKKNSQLLFRTDDRKLHAACGYTTSAKEIVAAELPIPSGKKVVVVGTPDLNKDGKTDIVTYDFDAKKMAVFLGGTPSTDSPNPQVSYLAEATATTASDDAGVDAAVTTDDAGDAGVDGDTVVVVTDDAGADADVDAGVDADVDAGDASVTPDTTSSSGSTSGGETTSSSGGSSSGKSSSSSGSSGKSSSGSSGKSSSSGDTGEKAGSSTSSSTSSSGNNAAPAASDDGGCSTTGSRSHEAPTGSVALGLAVGIMLLGQRRRRQA